MRNLYLIIRREFLERVGRKSFIITTILMPILMIGLMAAPSLVMLMAGPESKNIAVVDLCGGIAPTLQSDEDLKFIAIYGAPSLDSLKRDVEYDGVLVIGADVVKNPSNVQLYTHSASSLQTEGYISSQLSNAIEDIRIKQYDIDNLKDIMESVKADVQISSYRVDNDRDEATSSIASYVIGMGMSMLLYMFIIIYGNMVMTSIIEEKNNRVLEIIVSSVKPKALMLGKIVGVGLVAVTQILIWALLVGCFSFWVMPILSAGVESTDADLIAAMEQLGNTWQIMVTFGYILLFLIGGFMLYASIFAAVGSSVDNVQDASQLSSIAVVPILLGMIFSMTVAADPNSALAFWLSMIPFTSPMVMMARIPFGIPTWEIWVSLCVLWAAFFVMIWLSGKIYRVGIFMYGKKPSVKDIIRWATYK